MNIYRDPSKEIIDNIIKLLNKKKFLSVVNQALVLTKKYPQAYMVWNILGAANNYLGKEQEASEAFKVVTKLNPTFPEGFNNFGISQQKLGNLKEAI